MTGEHLHISKQRISINPSLFFILNTAHSDPRIKIDLKKGNDANLEEHALNIKILLGKFYLEKEAWRNIT